METVLRVPLSRDVDDYREYKRLRRVQREWLRQKAAAALLSEPTSRVANLDKKSSGELVCQNLPGGKDSMRVNTPGVNETGLIQSRKNTLGSTKATIKKPRNDSTFTAPMRLSSSPTIGSLLKGAPEALQKMGKSIQASGTASKPPSAEPVTPKKGSKGKGKAGIKPTPEAQSSTWSSPVDSSSELSAISPQRSQTESPSVPRKSGESCSNGKPSRLSRVSIKRLLSKSSKHLMRSPTASQSSVQSESPTQSCDHMPGSFNAGQSHNQHPSPTAIRNLKKPPVSIISRSTKFLDGAFDGGKLYSTSSSASRRRFTPTPHHRGGDAATDLLQLRYARSHQGSSISSHDTVVAPSMFRSPNWNGPPSRRRAGSDDNMISPKSGRRVQVYHPSNIPAKSVYAPVARARFQRLANSTSAFGSPTTARRFLLALSLVWNQLVEADYPDYGVAQGHGAASCSSNLDGTAHNDNDDADAEGQQELNLVQLMALPKCPDGGIHESSHEYDRRRRMCDAQCWRIPDYEIAMEALGEAAIKYTTEREWAEFAGEGADPFID